MATSMKKPTEIDFEKTEHCTHCDAKCSTRLKTSRITLGNIILGRPTQTETHYFCSLPCANYMVRDCDLHYITVIVPDIEELLETLTNEINEKLKSPNRDETEIGVMLTRLKSLKATYNLYVACIAGQPIQELILLQSKALKMLGDLLEEVHDSYEEMNKTLCNVEIVQNLHLDLLAS